LLNGITFRAVGFTEPLSVKADRAKLDFPTRIDWDQFFSANSDQMDEKEPGERPDTVYISGLPFDWFQVFHFKQRSENLLFFFRAPSTNQPKKFSSGFSVNMAT
jgi:hypothetical protein